MATTLRARSSTVPIPTGQVKRVGFATNAGVRAWALADNYFHYDAINSSPMVVGPFTGEGAGQYYLHARAWCIQSTAGGWENAVTQLRLVDGAFNPIADATNRYQCYAYHTMEGTSHPGGWRQCLTETCFQVAGGPLYVQFLGGGGGAASNYYCYADHIGMVGWTVGEGVY